MIGFVGYKELSAQYLLRWLIQTAMWVWFLHNLKEICSPRLCENLAEFYVVC